MPAPPEGIQPSIVLGLGIPGSGKSTVLKNIGYSRDKFIWVDPDDARSILPEYKEYLEAGYKDAAWLVHDEASKASKELLERAIAQNKPIVCDAVGQNLEKYIELIEKLRGRYRIIVVSVDLPPQTTWQRTLTRFQENGRYVPPDYFRETLDSVPKNTLALKDLVDEFYLFDNRGTHPSIIYKKINQEENAYNKDFWKEYNRIYGTERQERLGPEQLLPGSMELGSVEGGLAGGLVEGGYVHRAGPGHYGGGVVPAGSEEPRAVDLPLGEIEKHYPMPTTEAEVEAYSSIVEPVLNNLEGRLQSVEMQRAGPLEERIRSGLKENYPDLT